LGEETRYWFRKKKDNQLNVKMWAEKRGGDENLWRGEEWEDVLWGAGTKNPKGGALGESRAPQG